VPSHGVTHRLLATSQVCPLLQSVVARHCTQRFVVVLHTVAKPRVPQSALVVQVPRGGGVPPSTFRAPPAPGLAPPAFAPPWPVVPPCVVVPPWPLVPPAVAPPRPVPPPPAVAPPDDAPPPEVSPPRPPAFPPPVDPEVSDEPPLLLLLQPARAKITEKPSTFVSFTNSLRRPMDASPAGDSAVTRCRLPFLAGPNSVWL
jgi:hypothetical protein